MKTKLVAMVALFLTGCGLDTMGQGSGSDDFAEPDIGPDEVEPDVPEADQEDATEDETADEVEPDEATPDETDEDIMDIVEDVEPEDAAEAEAEAEAEDEGGEEDGEVVDPCARPDIPATGLYVFYCFVDDLRSDMTLWLQIERSGVPIVAWRAEPGCTATSARSLFCELDLRYNAVYLVNITLDPSIGIGWSCGPGLAETWGTPRVWLDRREQIVTPRANMDGGCNHLFTTPPGP